MTSWLSLIVWIPALTAILIALLPSRWVQGIRALAILGGGASAALSWYLYSLCLGHDLTRFQFVENIPWLPEAGIQYKLGVDGLSLGMLGLTGLVCWAALWMSMGIV